MLWVPEEGHDLRTPVNHERISINDQGFRYPTHVGLKSGRQLRIFAFGDSVTMGWGVDDNSHYSAVLEKLLNSGNCPDAHVQVISAGVNAYPNSLVVERLKTVFEDNLDPDLAIVAYSFNTELEALPQLQGPKRQRILRGVAIKSFLRHSAIYDAVVEDLLRAVAYYRFRDLMTQGTWSTRYHKPEVSPQKFTAGLQAALEVTRAHNSQMVLLLLSSADQSSELHPYQQAMIDFAQANHVPLVNMFNSWRTVDRSALFMDHVHPVAAGHAQIANALAQTIQALPVFTSVCKTVPETSVSTR